MSWEHKIVDVIARCKASGREPQCLIINPSVYCKLIWELSKKYWCGMFPESGKITTFLGLTVLQTPRIPDFQVIDDRSWVYQEW